MKTILTLMMVLIMASCVSAEPLQLADITDRLPPLDNGVAYDIDKGKIVYTSTLNLLEWKGIVLNGGYSTLDSIIVGVSYELTNLEKLGVKVPILKYAKIEPMIYCGLGSLNVQTLKESEFTYGVGVKLLEVDF